MCLGQEDAADLRTPLRVSDSDALLEQAIRDAGRWPLREVEREAMMELGMWNHYTSIPRKTEE